MTSVCFYFQVHQPRRVKKYRIFDVGRDHLYFNDRSESKLNNHSIMTKVMHKCYLPANETMLRMLKKDKKFKIAYSLSGIFLEQALEDFPEIIESFKRLIDTGRVELLSETYYHSLSYLYSVDEFMSQVKLHKKLLKDLFAVQPNVFRNTELIFSNDIAHAAEQMGYRGILAEGADHILGWRSPNFLYRAKGTKKIALLLKNYALSDDIAFRFSSQKWAEWPLTAPKFARWVSAVNGNGEVVNLFMDYETFGEHQWEDTGIFHFLEALPGEILKHPDNDFVTPSEAIARYAPKAELDVPQYVSWADVERDLSAWRSNAMQSDALASLYALEKRVHASKDKKLIEDWRRLTTSDHFYYMCTKWFSDGDVHKYFNPYESPYDAFVSFMNVIADVQLRVREST